MLARIIDAEIDKLRRRLSMSCDAWPRPARGRAGRHATRFGHTMRDECQESRPAPTGWLEALQRSEADVTAGRVVSSWAVMERLRMTTRRNGRERRFAHGGDLHESTPLAISAEAAAQVEEFRECYRRIDRLKAVWHLAHNLAFVEMAATRQGHGRHHSDNQPPSRRYPGLARHGRFWMVLRRHRFWIAYAIQPAVVHCVFKKPAGPPYRSPVAKGSTQPPTPAWCTDRPVGAEKLGRAEGRHLS